MIFLCRCQLTVTDILSIIERKIREDTDGDVCAMNSARSTVRAPGSLIAIDCALTV